METATMKHTLSTMILSISIGLSSNAQAAGNCTTMLDDLMGWAKTPIFGENSVGVTITTNVDSRKFASYSTANLDYKKGIWTKFGYTPDRLVGDGETFFSDRQWDSTPPGCTGFCFPDWQPFNPKKKDKFRLSLTKHTDNTKVNVAIILLSWGNSKVNFQAQCDNGHIYGFKKDHHGTHLYDLTFNKDQILYPK
jgi:hypothetical protein